MMTVSVLKQHTVDGFNYYHQVQRNLALTGGEMCDFCVWTPQDLVIFLWHVMLTGCLT